MTKRRASFLLLLAAAMWGSSFVASKVCINHGMMQFEIVFYRFLLGIVLIIGGILLEILRPQAAPSAAPEEVP